MLWSFDDLTRLRMAEQVAIVNGAKAEILEPVSLLVLERVVQFALGARHEIEHAIVHESEAMTKADRLRERVHILVLHLFVDEGGQQAGGQARVLGLLRDQAGRGLDRELVESLRGRAV